MTTTAEKSLGLALAVLAALVAAALLFAGCAGVAGG